ncbi:rod shape-determining protein MreC [Azospira restricta]|uniref:Cell shape-determining protein MreC n=2 Tax=Azospira restricta TaxID=404405 RepID=A0A974SQG6_9RHOO|nr:rod shape-determining protein MreC [Azospira restricta]
MAAFDHSPPPFFKRGPAPLAMLTLYVAVAVSLLVLDARFRYLEILRQALGVVTHPLQQLAHAPARGLAQAGEYFQSVDALQDENQRLTHAKLESAPQLLRLQQLEAENARLRRLLAVRDRQPASGQVAQILYTARDPFTRRVVVDKGQQDKIAAGQPVVDDAGIVGQVTRVYPFVSEVTLITDKDQAVPVQIVRNGLRSVVFGLGNGQLELRFMPANADVQVGDLLVTSGLDGIFLPGFPVAKVLSIERDTAYSFARIVCAPVAGVENFGEVMVLAQREAPPPRPEPAEAVDGAPEEKVVKARKKRPQRH